MVMKGMLSIFIIAACCACAASESIQYIATGRVCRPKNNDDILEYLVLIPHNPVDKNVMMIRLDVVLGNLKIMIG